MQNLEGVLTILGIIVIAAPAMAVVILGVASLFSRTLSENAIDRVVRMGVLVGLAASVAVMGIMAWYHDPQIIIPLGDWVSLPTYHYTFSLKLVFDQLSMPFVVLSFVLCGTIVAFASRRAAEAVQKDHEGRILTWEEVIVARREWMEARYGKRPG